MKVIDPSEDVITFTELYRRITIAALKRHNGCLNESASAIGISRRSLRRWIDQYDLDVKQFKQFNNKL